MAKFRPRYTGTYVDGKLQLKSVSEVYGAGEGEDRYQAFVRNGKLHVTRRNPGMLDSPEAVLSREVGDQERGGPVQITQETASSNPADPRTVAAGYDEATQTLRVEWGDGGVAYNYYGVDPATAQAFMDSESPGRYINAVLNYFSYGPAE